MYYIPRAFKYYFLLFVSDIFIIAIGLIYYYRCYKPSYDLKENQIKFKTNLKHLGWLVFFKLSVIISNFSNFR